MKVQSVPSDDSGCGVYRTFLPAVASASDDLTVHAHLPVVFDSPAYGRVVDADPYAPDVDVVAVHRPMSRHMFEALTILQSKGVAVVVDIDDDLEAIPRGIKAWDAAQPHRNPDENWRWFAKIAARADWVTVSTPQLAEVYGSHGRVTVVPNTVPSEWLGFTRAEGDPLTVGWAGSPAHHPFDLEQTAGQVGQVVAEQDARFHTIGHPDTLERLKVAGTWEPWMPWGEYVQALAKFDVGLVPLKDSRFNRGKSWLKGLELAALGIPFVASPTPEYRRLDAGLLAKGAGGWRKHLTALLTARGLREEVIGRGRDAAARWTVEGNVHLWWEAWGAGCSRRATVGRSAAA